MSDKLDDLIGRRAEVESRSLLACSMATELMIQSEELLSRLAGTQQAAARVTRRLQERPARAGNASGPGPGADDTAVSHQSRAAGMTGVALPQEPSDVWGRQGAKMLDENEAATLAALLEELAARHPADPLSAPALQAAALLRQRITAQPRWVIRSGPEVTWARRQSGDSRDDAADSRDVLALERDRLADQRDEHAVQRRHRADTADVQAKVSEQRVRDLLSNAQLRDEAAAGHAAVAAGGDDGAFRHQWQLDQAMAEADRARSAKDREAFREILSQISAAREAAALDRGDDAQDRLASRRDRRSSYADRQDASDDRQAARADRDQAVIDGEEQDPSRD